MLRGVSGAGGGGELRPRHLGVIKWAPNMKKNEKRENEKKGEKEEGGQVRE